jgi:NDP-sugar pyrophosphorylase family protein
MTAWPPPALVLTAGLGTRLRPLTTYRAKPAMPVGSDPLVGRILRQIAAAGITEAVLNLHHLPASITREVGDGTQYGLRVRYSWEQPLVLGSGGGPRHALPLLDGDTLLIVNGDTLCDLPIRDVWEAHVASGARVTLGLMPHPEAGRYGGVTIDDRRMAGVAAGSAAVAGERGPTRAPLAQGAVTGFVPRSSRVPSAHFPGIQFVHRSVFATLPDDVPASSVGGVYDALIAAQPGAIHGIVFDARFEDVGTVDDYRRTCLELAGDASGNVVAPTAEVDASATLRDTIVWPGAVIPAGCTLERVIVTGHVPVAPGTHASGDIL